MTKDLRYNINLNNMVLGLTVNLARGTGVKAPTPLGGSVLMEEPIPGAGFSVKLKFTSAN